MFLVEQFCDGNEVVSHITTLPIYRVLLFICETFPITRTRARRMSRAELMLRKKRFHPYFTRAALLKSDNAIEMKQLATLFTGIAYLLLQIRIHELCQIVPVLCREMQDSVIGNQVNEGHHDCASVFFLTARTGRVCCMLRCSRISSILLSCASKCAITCSISL